MFVKIKEDIWVNSTHIISIETAGEFVRLGLTNSESIYVPDMTLDEVIIRLGGNG